MALSKVRILREKLKEVMEAIAQASDKQKEHRVSRSVADDFNSVLSAVRTEFPAIRDELPEPVPHDGMLSRAGKAPATFLDLQIKAGQALRLVELAEYEG